jgi:hypothetical protein
MDPGDFSLGGMDWIHLAEDTDQWRALLDMVLYLRLPQDVENSLYT